MLAATFSFIMLGFGGAGGIINMTYQLNASIHNTQWVTGHFHLIFGGAIVIMYFAIAYDLWPHLTGRSLTELRLMRTQLWLWFIGMMVTSFPWHWVGILGMPRRMAYFDFTNPALQPAGLWVIVSAIGGLVLVASGIVFFAVLIRGSTASKAEIELYRFAEAVHPPVRVPAALNGYTVWVTLMILLTVTNYGFPVLNLAARSGTSVPAIYVGVEK